MSTNKRNNQKRQKRGPKLGPALPPPKFWRQASTAFLVFIIIISLYSLITENQKTLPEVSISEITTAINAGEVSKIVVVGNDLTITYTNGDEKKSQKEGEASLTETLANYKVPADKLALVSIDVQKPSGFGYWFSSFAPFLLPLIFIIFFIWFLSRQVKGAGMQAFSFGQSKARITMPDDKKQKVTFKDVAGCKEAKQELSEIVDFLKNPKKFLEIGAVIPKGILLMGAPGTGKCVTGETRVLTTKGLVRMDDIPKHFSVKSDSTIQGLDVVALDQKLGFNTITASHWYDLGVQETRIVETNMGTEIQGTPEHPIVVVDEATGNCAFKHLGELNEGEWAVHGYNTQVFGSYTKIPHPDVAYLLGVLTGDGCLTIRDRIALSTADSEILELAQRVGKTYLGKTFSKVSSGKYDYELRSLEAKAKLLEWGLQETYARHKRVPEWIQIAPRPFVEAFIRGVFDTDGTVEKTGSVSFSSASKFLIQDVHTILLNLGVVSRVYSRKKKYNGTNQFYIVIYGDFIEKFKETVGFRVVRKQERLVRACAKQRNTNVNLLPGQGEIIKSIWSATLKETERVLNRSFYSEGLYKNVKRYISGDRTPSMEGISTFIEGVKTLAPSMKLSPQLGYLERLAQGQLFFSQVKRVSTGRARVYDLTVPVLHNFIANGFINHNTLLARAVAGEAGVAFFSISGSEFVEMFVGVGASRVRDLFKMAKQTAPAIVFVDEIDAVGRVRGTGVGGGNDEREQTLNQILVEMDGFEPNEKVIVMAATNRPDVLDPALLRPGRFDRRVTIDLPDRDDREEILKIHAKKKPFAEDMNLRIVAERTPGFSGADLYSLMNEGAILAAREDRTKISQFDLIRSIEKVMLGPERRSHLLSKKEKEITAYHEAGHALVASVSPFADPVHKISIISRGRAAGYTLHLPLEDRKLQSKREFLDDIAVSLGGYVTEKMIFGDLTTGPSNDLQVSTALARDMITKYGMSEKMGPIALEGEGGRALFGRGVNDHEYSERVGAEIDAEVSRIMNEAMAKAEKILTENRKALDAIAIKLIEVENIERAEYEQIIIAHGIMPKKKLDIEHQA